MADACECSNEPSGSVKCGEFLGGETGGKYSNSLPSYIKDKLQDIMELKRLIDNFLYCNTFHA